MRHHDSSPTHKYPDRRISLSKKKSDEGARDDCGKKEWHQRIDLPVHTLILARQEIEAGYGEEDPAKESLGGRGLHSFG